MKTVQVHINQGITSLRVNNDLVKIKNIGIVLMDDKFLSYTE